MSRRSSVFHFQQFSIEQGRSAMKVCTDSCIFGAWVARHLPVGTLKILDVGCGTGLLGFMQVQMHPELQVVGIESDPGSYSDALYNVANSRWAYRMAVYLSAWEEWKGREYDAVICNPPFFVDQLPASEKRSRSAKHLGMNAWQDWVSGLVRFVKPDGIIFLLLHPSAWEDAARRMETEGFMVRHKVCISQEGKGIWRILVAFSWMVPEEMKPLEIPLYSDDGHFSDFIMDWLSDFYLEKALLQRR